MTTWYEVNPGDNTLEKELQQVGSQGYVALGMTVSKTLMGGNELVTIMRRRGRSRPEASDAS